MPATSVIGLQWGDEAKGKIADLLASQHDIVVRYQGGANAGHTVVAEGKTYKLSLVPSGILTPGVTSVIASGVVINPAKLLEEINVLETRAPDGRPTLLVSDRAHVIFPWHFVEDRALDELSGGGEHIGTTQRGIGPCYRDKAGRTHAIRLGDLFRDGFRGQLQRIVAAKNTLLRMVNGSASIDADEVYAQYSEYARALEPFMADTNEYLLTAAEADKRILLEGAQGALLDVDHGTYPFVTSSNSSGVGASSGSGVPARYIRHVMGVLKAYSTRVGGGPFPTEQDNEVGQRIRDRGNEYGTVTRRPRRCGWLDMVALRYAVRLSGVHQLCVMLLDVLSGLPEIKICTRYRIAGRDLSTYPSHVDDLKVAEPVYETLPGWQEDITTARTYDALPAAARNYLERLEQLTERPVGVVSVGPDRAQTIFRQL